VVKERTQTAPPPANDVITALASKIHLLVVGHTGGGKSVLLHNLAARLAGDGADVLVCDVDAIAGRYPGYRVVGAGDDYDAITTALALVRSQVEKRRAARASGTRAFKPMWLFIDEAHDVFDSVDGARDLFIDIVRRGRKLNVHAAIGTQDSQVKTLGLEGQSKTLINLTRVDVALVGRDRGATVDGVTHPIPPLPHPDDTVRPLHIDNAPVVPQATQATHTRPLDHQTDTPQTCVQRGAQSVDGALLAALLDSSLAQSDHQSVSDQTRPQTTPDQSGESVQTSGSKLDQTSGSKLDQTTIDQEIRHLLAAGMSKNAIWEWLREQGITRSKGAAYQMINQATKDTTPTHDDGGGCIDKESNDAYNS
jgi:hypothetical protein